MTEDTTTPAAARQLDLQLQLLDRQVSDPNGEFVCKVDDLELDLDADGRPYVVAILVGPRALGPRIGGRLGRWICAITERLADTEGPPRIDFEHVTDIGDDIRVNRTRQELQVEPLEEWTLAQVIGRIPGSRDAGT